MEHFDKECVCYTQTTLIKRSQVVLCFQPDIAFKLLNCNATELVLANSEPFAGKPVEDVHSGPEYPHFVTRLTRYYNDMGYYLAHVVMCTPHNEALYKRVGCCGKITKPKHDYCDKPYKLVFVRQTGGNSPARVYHYISTSFPHHLSDEFVRDAQRATHLLISTRWVPPTTVLHMLDDPIPIPVVVDQDAKHGTSIDKFHISGHW